MNNWLMRLFDDVIPCCGNGWIPRRTFIEKVYFLLCQKKDRELPSVEFYDCDRQLHLTSVALHAFKKNGAWKKGEPLKSLDRIATHNGEQHNNNESKSIVIWAEAHQNNKRKSRGATCLKWGSLYYDWRSLTQLFSVFLDQVNAALLVECERFVVVDGHHAGAKGNSAIRRDLCDFSLNDYCLWIYS